MTSTADRMTDITLPPMTLPTLPPLLAPTLDELYDLLQHELPLCGAVGVPTDEVIALLQDCLQSPLQQSLLLQKRTFKQQYDHLLQPQTPVINSTIVEQTVQALWRRLIDDDQLEFFANDESAAQPAATSSTDAPIPTNLSRYIDFASKVTTTNIPKHVAAAWTLTDEGFQTSKTSKRQMISPRDATALPAFPPHYSVVSRRQQRAYALGLTKPDDIDNANAAQCKLMYCALEAIGSCKWQGINQTALAKALHISAGKVYDIVKQLGRREYLTTVSHPTPTQGMNKIIFLPHYDPQHHPDPIRGEAAILRSVIEARLALPGPNKRIDVLEGMYEVLNVKKEADGEAGDVEAAAPADDEVDTADTIQYASEQVIELPMPAQVYRMIDAAGSRGITMPELRGRLHMPSKPLGRIIETLQKHAGLTQITETIGKTQLYRLFTHRHQPSHQSNGVAQASTEEKSAEPQPPATPKPKPATPTKKTPANAKATGTKAVKILQPQTPAASQSNTADTSAAATSTNGSPKLEFFLTRRRTSQNAAAAKRAAGNVMVKRRMQHVLDALQASEPYHYLPAYKVRVAVQDAEVRLDGKDPKSKVDRDTIFRCLEIMRDEGKIQLLHVAVPTITGVPRPTHFAALPDVDFNAPEVMQHVENDAWITVHRNTTKPVQLGMVPAQPSSESSAVAAADEQIMQLSTQVEELAAQRRQAAANTGGQYSVRQLLLRATAEGLDVAASPTAKQPKQTPAKRVAETTNETMDSLDVGAAVWQDAWAESLGFIAPRAARAHLLHERIWHVWLTQLKFATTDIPDTVRYTYKLLGQQPLSQGSVYIRLTDILSRCRLQDVMELIGIAGEAAADDLVFTPDILTKQLTELPIEYRQALVHKRQLLRSQKLLQTLADLQALNLLMSMQTIPTAQPQIISTAQMMQMKDWRAQNHKEVLNDSISETFYVMSPIVSLLGNQFDLSDVAARAAYWRLLRDSCQSVVRSQLFEPGLQGHPGKTLKPGAEEVAPVLKEVSPHVLPWIYTSLHWASFHTTEQKKYQQIIQHCRPLDQPPLPIREMIRLCREYDVRPRVFAQTLAMERYQFVKDTQIWLDTKVHILAQPWYYGRSESSRQSVIDLASVKGAKRRRTSGIQIKLEPEAEAEEEAPAVEDSSDESPDLLSDDSKHDVESSEADSSDSESDRDSGSDSGEDSGELSSSSEMDVDHIEVTGSSQPRQRKKRSLNKARSDTGGGLRHPLHRLRQQRSERSKETKERKRWTKEEDEQLWHVYKSWIRQCFDADYVGTKLTLDDLITSDDDNDDEDEVDDYWPIGHHTTFASYASSVLDHEDYTHDRCRRRINAVARQHGKTHVLSVKHGVYPAADSKQATLSQTHLAALLTKQPSLTPIANTLQAVTFCQPQDFKPERMYRALERYERSQVQEVIEALKADHFIRDERQRATQRQFRVHTAYNEALRVGSTKALPAQLLAQAIERYDNADVADLFEQPIADDEDQAQQDGHAKPVDTRWGTQSMDIEGIHALSLITQAAAGRIKLDIGMKQLHVPAVDIPEGAENDETLFDHGEVEGEEPADAAEQLDGDDGAPPSGEAATGLQPASTDGAQTNEAGASTRDFTKYKPRPHTADLFTIEDMTVDVLPVLVFSQHQTHESDEPPPVQPASLPAAKADVLNAVSQLVVASESSGIATDALLQHPSLQPYASADVNVALQQLTRYHQVVHSLGYDDERYVPRRSAHHWAMPAYQSEQPAESITQEAQTVASAQHPSASDLATTLQPALANGNSSNKLQTQSNDTATASAVAAVTTPAQAADAVSASSQPVSKALLETPIADVDAVVTHPWSTLTSTIHQDLLDVYEQTIWHYLADYPASREQRIVEHVVALAPSETRRVLATMLLDGKLRCRHLNNTKYYSNNVYWMAERVVN